MNLKYFYWCFQNAVPNHICDDIVRWANTKKERVGVIGGQDGGKKLGEDQLKDLKQTRDSNIVWLNDVWIYRHVQPFVHMANIYANWNFDWDWSEEMQFTKYKVGQFYGWHMDCFDEPYNKPEEPHRHGKLRKLSVTLQLSNEDDYEGGELEFQPRTSEKNALETFIPEESFKKGTLVIFPSHIHHRVRPVTKGTRYSLVMWNLGKPFK
tara:strand:+ start:2314 stop:2940 length:627 start_codon:yes stop_codon:yes gene_type:complete